MRSNLSSDGSSSPRRPSQWSLKTPAVLKTFGERVKEQEEFNQMALQRRHLLNRPALDLQKVHFMLTMVSEESLKVLMARVPRSVATQVRPWSPLPPQDHRTTIFDDLPTQTVTEMCSSRWCRRTSLVLRAAAFTARTPDLVRAPLGATVCSVHTWIDVVIDIVIDSSEEHPT